MYESFFGCRQRPFAAAPQVERYFPGRTIDAARQALQRCIDRAEGAALIVGPAGTGKTLLALKAAHSLSEQLAIVRLGNGGLQTRRAFFQAVLYELNLPYRGLEEGELRLSLIERLTADADRGILLIIDDAHALPLRLLEEVRMLADVARRGEPRVRLVLVGASSLEERLAVPRLAALQQRITTRCYLEALDFNDTAAYLRHQITIVGGDPPNVFSPSAADAVYRATEGIPRLINQTCDHALVLACAGGVKPIDGRGIEEAWSDLQQLPTPWSRVPGAAAPSGDDDGVIEFAPLDDERPNATAAPTGADSARIENDALAAAANTVELHRAAEAVYAVAPDDVIEIVALDPDEFDHPPSRTPAASETPAAEWCDEYLPAPRERPEVELVLGPGRRDPFAEDFVEEEIVVDRYAAADRLTGPRVFSYGSDARILSAFAEMTRSDPASARRAAEPVEPEDPAPAPHARFDVVDPVEPEDLVIAPRRPTGDAEMIIVEDDPPGDEPSAEAAVVRNRDYRRMFAKLRRPV